MHLLSFSLLSRHMQLVELKEAEKESLKESERIEKELAELQEMKVRMISGETCILQSICQRLVVHASIIKSIFPFALTYTCSRIQQNISTMTADEYFAKHPEVKQKFDDEIRNDNWGY